jgi:hypothetical protein
MPKSAVFNPWFIRPPTWGHNELLCTTSAAALEIVSNEHNSCDIDQNCTEN